jgi:hypothetical protein
MGRYAHFTSPNGSQSFHYKFWLGVQDSSICWANEFLRYWLYEYDEEQADEHNLSEEARQFWQDNADTEVEEHNLPEELQVVACQQYMACDNADDLDSHLEETDALARSLGLEPFPRPEEEDWLDYVDQYLEKQIDPLYKVNEDDYETKKKLADLHLKVVICSILHDWCSYDCSFEI